MSERDDASAHSPESGLNALLPASVTQQNGSVTAGARGVEREKCAGESEAVMVQALFK